MGAFKWRHTLWALLNFLDAGSPSSTLAIEDSVGRAFSGEWTAQHEGYARTMYAKVLRYCAHPRGTMDRGPAKLSELIARIQSSHEAILKEAGCLKENQTLTYGKVFPCSNTLEGLYIDDHLAFQVIDAKLTRDREPHGDGPSSFRKESF